VQKNLLKEKVKMQAVRLGFDFCGFSKADFLEDEAPRLEQWLKNGMHGKMQYMENHFDKRLDPRKLVPGAKTVISLLQNYYTEEKQPEGAPKISMYAYGNDYHIVIKNKLKQLMAFIREQAGNVNGRAFVDSAPVLDRAWAKRSGLGWIGKNTQLINPKSGSYYFLAELILDLDFPPDVEIKDYCGTCNRCIEACPTQAIIKPYVVDGSKCISYFTIELKEEIPAAYHDKMDGWAFGCDVCQQVCPWNRFSKPNQEPELKPDRNLMNMQRKDWIEMKEEVFNKMFARSPLKRAQWKGMKRNLLLPDAHPQKISS
jgi:epoxyqueuosine reductase